MINADKIKDILEEEDVDFKERNRTIYATCPSCHRSDKFSILKSNGSCICYHGNCDFGRQWFEHWLSLTANISYKEARDRIHGVKSLPVGRIDLPSDQETDIDVLEPIEWPVSGFMEIDNPEAAEGASYLKGRGVDIALAKHYDIRYSMFFRRVILPIKMDGKCYGWQGRAIDVVDPKDRMRNNEGFRRDKLLMFFDTITPNNNVMFFEGPFDALKFHKFGGIVSSMGKDVSDSQIELINESDVDRVYLGLDLDAADVSKKLAKRIDKPIFVLELPQSCLDRCYSTGKKPDFGECNDEEVQYVFNNAKPITAGHIFVHMQDPNKIRGFKW